VPRLYLQKDKKTDTAGKSKSSSRSIMNKEKVKEELEACERKMRTLEWDIKHNKIIAKEYMYEELKNRCEELAKQLQ
jgi:hypothetical protein